MTVLETLNACRDMAIETNLLLRLTESVSMPGCGCRSQQVDGMPRGGNDNTAAAVARIGTYEKWYADAHARLVLLAEDVEDVIALLPLEEKALMRHYYVEGKTDAECAALMGWTRRATATEKRRDILGKLAQTP